MPKGHGHAACAPGIDSDKIGARHVVQGVPWGILSGWPQYEPYIPTTDGDVVSLPKQRPSSDGTSEH